MARVVHSSLDTLVQGVALGRRLVAKLGVDGRGEALRHTVVVLAQVRIVSTAGRGEALSGQRLKEGALKRALFPPICPPGSL